MTLVWGHPLVPGGRVVTAELAGLAVDQCELIDERFTLIAPDDYRQDLLEIRLFGSKNQELARESLYAAEARRRRRRRRRPRRNNRSPLAAAGYLPTLLLTLQAASARSLITPAGRCEALTRCDARFLGHLAQRGRTATRGRLLAGLFECALGARAGSRTAHWTLCLQVATACLACAGVSGVTAGAVVGRRARAGRRGSRGSALAAGCRVAAAPAAREESSAGECHEEPCGQLQCHLSLRSWTGRSSSRCRAA